tara:strand:- start:5202 stop:6263 length:1062 start_codon:yes stop_codon:yes gene_type:complete
MPQLNLERFIREDIKALKPYYIESFDCDIKLHANENPFPPSPEIQRVFIESLSEIELNRYPEPSSKELRSILSERLGVSQERLVVGNGSDELIFLLMQVFCKPGDAVAFPDPTFAMYSIIAKGMGLKPVAFPLDDQWDFHAEPFLKLAQQNGVQIIFISYPNNPTGNCFSKEQVKKIIEEFEGIVVLDEAYFDFSQKSFIDIIEAHNNLVILRSLSKIGLAALRVGFGVAHSKIIDEINKVRLPYNSNAVSQKFSAKALSNFPIIQEQIDKIRYEQKRLYAALSQIQSITVFSSDSNFILFRSESEIFSGLVDAGILIRDLNSHPRLNSCLRVTVGSPEENDAFIKRIKLLAN